MKRLGEESVGGVTPIDIVVFCRAGEKRSVSIAWLLSECLRRHAGWEEVEPIDPLCSCFWVRKTCGGVNCQECNLASGRHLELVEKLEPYFVSLPTVRAGPMP